MHPFAEYLKVRRIANPAWIAAAAIALALGCNASRLVIDPPTTTPMVGLREVSLSESNRQNQVLAQGRIQPAKGIVRINALPGDRIDEILVRPGQTIQKDQPLIVMQSHQLKRLELETALLKLEEARSMLSIKKQEADLAIEAAQLKIQSSKQMLLQATAQQDLAKKGTEQVVSLKKQISTLQELRDSPLTRAAIGTVELETKKNDLLRATSVSEQTLLAADQGVEMAKLQLSQSEKSLLAANETRQLVDRSAPIDSLQKQIEILQVQLQQTNLISPINGVVISLNAEVGERSAQIPLAEVADVTSMVCVAEVHESDVSKIAIDDPVELRSSALGKALSGHVMRIDRVVGAVQLRSPNPMARSDFRAIPVWISIDKQDTDVAAQRLQLQVEVSIGTIR